MDSPIGVRVTMWDGHWMVLVLTKRIDQPIFIYVCRSVDVYIILTSIVFSDLFDFIERRGGGGDLRVIGCSASSYR